MNNEFSLEFEKIPAYDPSGTTFEDFENGYEHWEITGTAFGEAPAAGAIGSQNSVEGFKGNGLVNSFNGGDASIGTLTSKEFKIEKSFINLRVGGGNDNNATYVALIIDDKEVRKAVGSNAEQLKLRSWNVEEFLGRNAKIKIVDSHRAGWGHINVDQIEFSDEEAKAEFEKAVWLDYGADNYAGVTWSNVPKLDGRRLFIGWMSNWEYAQNVPTYEWRSAMTIPRELKLYYTNSKYRVHSAPVKELEEYVGDEVEGLTDSTYLITAEVTGDFKIKISNGLKEESVISLTNDKLIFDRTRSGKTDFSPRFGSSHIVDVENVEVKSIQVYVDTSSIEVFINNGEIVMTELVFPSQPYTKVFFDGNGLPKPPKSKCIRYTT